jgi:hypothetical protein
MRYELTYYEWATIKPFLPNKPRGVPRVNDWRVLNGIFWVLRLGAPWRDLPDNSCQSAFRARLEAMHWHVRPLGRLSAFSWGICERTSRGKCT